MSLNEKMGKCKGFVFRLVSRHVQKEILKLNGITLENRIIEIVKIVMYSTPQNFELERKPTLWLFDPKKRKMLHYR